MAKRIYANVIRQYVYQFVGSSDKISDVIFQDTQHGHISIGDKKIQVIAPITHKSGGTSNTAGIEIISFEGFTKTNPVCTKAEIEWKANKKATTRNKMIFEVGKTYKNKPFEPKSKSKIPVSELYKVRNIHTEITESEIWGIVEFENLIPVLVGGKVEYEIFSLSCYDVKAEVLNLTHGT